MFPHLVIAALSGCQNMQPHLGMDRQGNIPVENHEEIDSWHRAIESGDTASVRRLLAHGVDVNEVDGDGDTPLHNAVYEGHTEVAQLLLDHRANVNAVDSDGNTPLHCASRIGREETVHLLLQRRSRYECSR